MATLSELQAQRDELKEALASGVYQVRHGGKSVMYQSADQMRRSLAAIEREIAAAEGKKPLRRVHFASSKGL